MSELPQGWATVTVGAIVDLDPKSTCDDSTEVGFIPMSLMGTHVRARPNFEARRWSEVKKGYTHFADGDVLLARITPCFENGKSGIPRGLPSGLGAGSTEYVVLRPVPKVLVPEILLAALSTDAFRRNGEMAMTGAVGQQRVPKQYVLGYQVKLPPFAEQHRIAHKLDAVLARIDSCRERLDRVPAILKRFREAVLEAAVSGRLTEEWRESHGLSLDSWSRATVGTLLTRIEAGLNVQCDERPPQPTEQGLIKISAVTWGKFDEEESKTLPKGREVPESTRVTRGDFLMSRANTLELVVACVIVDKVTMPVYLSDKVWRLVVDDQVKPWLLISLRSRAGRRQIEELASGNQLSMRNLSQANLKTIELSLPPQDERLEIVRRVDELFTLADQLETKYRAAVERVEQLTPAVLAKAFRGELVPQDPEDEPASVLLERTRVQRAGRSTTVETEQVRSRFAKQARGKKVGR